MQHVNRSFLSLTFLVICAAIGLTLNPVASAASPFSAYDRQPIDHCEGAIALQEGWTEGHLQSQERRLFAVHLMSPGIVNIEATQLDDSLHLPHVELLDNRCRPIVGTLALHRGHAAAPIHVGEMFYVRTTAPKTPHGASFRLQVAVAAPPSPQDLEEPMEEWEELEEPMEEWEERNTQGNMMAAGTAGPLDLEEPMEEWEELEEPMEEWEERNTQSNMMAAGTAGPLDLEEPMEEWEELEEPMEEWEERNTQGNLMAAGTAGPLDLEEPMEEWEELEEPMEEWEEFTGTDQRSLTTTFQAWRRAHDRALDDVSSDPMVSALDRVLCPRLRLDDHSETLGCASEIVPGGRLAAELSHSQVQDRDTYTFVVHNRARVTFASAGDLDLQATLLDVQGSALMQDDEGAGQGNFLLEATLPPGRYFLRVDSPSHYSGDYELHSAVAPEDWRFDL